MTLLAGLAVTGALAAVLTGFVNAFGLLLGLHAPGDRVAQGHRGTVRFLSATLDGGALP